MSLVSTFSITNQKGSSVGLSFGPSVGNFAVLTAFILQRREEGLVVLVNGLLSFMRLDDQWLPIVSADRSYLERPQDFMGVLQYGKLRRSDSWKEGKFSTFRELWRWRRHRGIGFFEQPTMKKCFEEEYKKYDPLGLGD